MEYQDFTSLLSGEDVTEDAGDSSDDDDAPSSSAGDLSDLTTPSITLGDWVTGAVGLPETSPVMSFAAFTGEAAPSPVEPARSGGPAARPAKAIKQLFTHLKGNLRR